MESAARALELDLGCAGAHSALSLHLEFHRLTVDQAHSLAQHPLRACLCECHARTAAIAMARLAVTFLPFARTQRKRRVSIPQSGGATWPTSSFRRLKHPSGSIRWAGYSACYSAPK